MKVGAFVLTLTLLMTMGRSADFGQIGIIDSGSETLITPKADATTTVTFNIGYAAAPTFASALTAMQTIKAEIYKILHSNAVTATGATISWDILELIYLIKFRWMASDKKPAILLDLTTTGSSSDGVPNGAPTSIILPSGIPDFSGSPIIVGLFISGFHYNTNNANYKDLYIEIIQPSTYTAYDAYAASPTGPVNLGLNPDTLSLTVQFITPANPSTRVKSLQLAVIIRQSTVNPTVASVGIYSALVSSAPSILSFSPSAGALQFESGSPDFFAGYKKIEFEFQSSTNTILSTDLTVRDSRTGEILSSEPTTYQSTHPLIFFFDKTQLTTCTPAVTPDATPAFQFTCTGSCGISGQNLNIVQNDANQKTNTLAAINPTPTAGAYQIFYGVDFNNGGSGTSLGAQVKVQVLDKNNNIIAEKTHISQALTAATQIVFTASDAQLPFTVKILSRDPTVSTSSKITTLTGFKIQPLSGQVFDQTTNACINIDSCKNLQYTPSTYTCKICTGGKVADPTTGLCKCPDGTYFDEALSQCKFCTTINCGTCLLATPNKCQTCPSGRTPDGNGACICGAGLISLGTVCGNCPSFCATCTSLTVCSDCIASTTVGGVATPTYRVKDATGKCVCDDTHYEVSGQLICQKCDPKCQTCDQTGKCLSCKDPNVLTTAAPDCACPDGRYYPSPLVDGLCLLCDISCATCNAPFPKCLTCSGPTRQKNADDTCPCADGFTEYPTRVASCQLATFCGTTGCITCNQNKCTSCDTDLGFSATPTADGKCQCASGYWLNPTNVARCTPCIDACKTCSSTTCSECYTGATTAAGCQCPSGTYPDKTTATCKNCAFTNCKTCSATQCTQCVAPRRFIAGVCTCPPGTVEPTCGPCPTTCKTCVASGCTECNTGNYLQPDSTTCAPTCPNGYYILGSGCAKCELNCATCTGQARCTVCTTGFLYQGICYQTCPARTYKSGSTCVDCDSKCQACDASATNCVKCSKAQQVLYNGQCLTSCPPNTVNSGGACKNCNNDCITCAPSIDFCYKCQNNRYSNNGVCVETCPSGTFPIPDRMICAQSCLPGQYYDQNTQVCAACSVSCRTCSDRLTCTSCFGNSYLFQSTCIRQCPSTTTGIMTANGGLCVVCLPECQTCSAPNVCATCPATANLYQGRCIACIGTSIFINGQCISCPPGCSECSGTTVTNIVCTRCIGQAVLIGGQCTTCISPCSTCGEAPNICTSCIAGYNLIENTCSLTCPSTDLEPSNGICRCRNNLVYYNNQCILKCPAGMGITPQGGCAACSANCQNCDANANVCTLCALGYNLQGGRCNLPNDCPYGQDRTDGVCTAICVTGTYFDQQTFCAQSCPAGTTLNNERTGCITGLPGPTSPCPIGQYFAFNACHVACPPATYTPVSGYVCVACPANCYQCTSEKCLYCIPGFYLTTAGTCVPSSACNPPQVSLGANCVAQCPPGTFNLNGFCAWICPSGTAFYEKWCYASCPRSLYKSGYVCVSNCPANTIPIAGVCTSGTGIDSATGAVDLSAVIDGCPAGTFTNSTTGQCQACNPPCATCRVTGSFCTSCIVGIPTNGVCRTSSRGGTTATALTAQVTNAFRAGSQVQIQVTLNRIPPLSPEAIARFFIVQFTPTIAAQTYQYKDQAQPKINVFINFASPPPANTIATLNFNTEVLGGPYEQAGFTDFSGANVRFLLSNARTPTGL